MAFGRANRLHNRHQDLHCIENGSINWKTDGMHCASILVCILEMSKRIERGFLLWGENTTCMHRRMTSGRQHLRHRPWTMYDAGPSKEPSLFEYQASNREISMVTPIWNRASSPAVNSHQHYENKPVHLKIWTNLCRLNWLSVFQRLDFAVNFNLFSHKLCLRRY